METGFLAAWFKLRVDLLIYRNILSENGFKALVDNKYICVNAFEVNNFSHDFEENRKASILYYETF